MSIDPGQLTLDGAPPAKSRGFALTPLQRELVTHLRERGELRTFEAGTLIHAWRGYCPPRSEYRNPNRGGGCCRLCTSAGFDNMQRLERRGLAKRAGRGRWVPTERRDERWVEHPRAIAQETRDEVVHLYHDKRVPVSAIAKRVYLSTSAVKSILRAEGIPRWPITYPDRRTSSDALLEAAQWYGRGYSAREVGSLTGVSESTVRYRLKLVGVKTRTRKQAQRARFERARLRAMA